MTQDTRQAPISILAPRGGSDTMLTLSPTTDTLFQSSLPVGGATIGGGDLMDNHIISILAPRGGSDSYIDKGYFARVSFQSSLPVGGATGAML